MLSARPDLRQAGEAQLMSWLQARQVAALGMVPELDAIDRATAANPKDLPKQQAAIAYWLSKKYRVAPEPLSALVAEAYEVGRTAKLDPTLILAIMAVESGFNPFAQSSVGAQGLMQVMTGVHSDKYEIFGGKLAAFDPVTNLRVGVKVLQECIQRAGSLQGGLKHYVGAALLAEDGGYADKVMAEHARLQQVAAGRVVPLAPPAAIRTVAPVPVKEEPAPAPEQPAGKVASLSIF
jgi:soluble lytic murein transglycosylase-like protein